ncbi:hypothetical protein FHX58_007680 [Paraburkholderia tropica]|nr:hypothetical protein [Paraburkholderia tropica]
MSGQWPKLVRYVENGNWPISNNLCENAIRPFVVGRKGWLFSDTVAGAQASANLYSLVETCLCRMRHRQVHADSQTMPNHVERPVQVPECFRFRGKARSSDSA